MHCRNAPAYHRVNIGTDTTNNVSKDFIRPTPVPINKIEKIMIQMINIP